MNVETLNALVAQREKPWGVAPKMKCVDGFEMSVQASRTHYCTPRDNNGPYTAFEVGFPTAEEPLLMPYVEYGSRPTDTVYRYVPADVVLAVIEKHGGASVIDPAAESYEEETMKDTGQLKKALDGTLKFAVGDMVCMAVDVERYRLEFDANGPVDLLARAGTPKFGTILERRIQECHGGVQVQYLVRFEPDSGSPTSGAVILFEYELRPPSEAADVCIAMAKVNKERNATRTASTGNPWKP